MPRRDRRKHPLPLGYLAGAVLGHTCPMPLAFPLLDPEGMDENSPGVQPWVCAAAGISPEGTVEATVVSRPFGTRLPRSTVPGLLAILSCPSGTGPKARLPASRSTQVLVALDVPIRSLPRIAPGLESATYLSEARCCGQECPRSAKHIPLQSGEGTW